MITFHKIGNHLWAEPFHPFRIRLASGRTFEIRHPEMVQVGKTRMTIFTFLSDDFEEGMEQQIDVPLLPVESVEPLETTAHSQGA